MHIVLLNYVYDPGFAAADTLLDRYDSLTGWAESLLAAGATQVTVLQRFGRDLDMRRGGVVYLLRADRSGSHARPWTYPRRLHQLAARLQPDVAHVNGLGFPVQTWLLRRALPPTCALLVQDHGGVPPAARSQLPGVGAGLGVKAQIWRIGLRAADGFLFTAADQARPWRIGGLIGRGQPVYDVVEAGRPLIALPRAAARAISRVSGDPALLWVGHLDANKDPLTVLDGFARALPQLPGARLTMVYATSPLLSQVQARLVADPALAERVELRGRVAYDAMAALFSAADIFVLGSHREGSGYALIEALGCGTVPVVTDIPSFRALTADGALGALWPPDDAAALAAALVEIGRRDRASLRAAIAAHHERALSWEAIGQRALEVYTQALARYRGGGRNHLTR